MVYKIDRLSRSLMDFAKLVEVFDKSVLPLAQNGRNLLTDNDTPA
jgi:DNA invertase Pin-like site-specific DNA recombinase